MNRITLPFSRARIMQRVFPWMNIAVLVGSQAMGWMAAATRLREAGKLDLLTNPEPLEPQDEKALRVRFRRHRVTFGGKFFNSKLFAQQSKWLHCSGFVLSLDKGAPQFFFFLYCYCYSFLFLLLSFLFFSFLKFARLPCPRTR